MDKAERVTSHLASAGVMTSPPTRRELQLAALNETLDVRSRYPHDQAAEDGIALMLTTLDDAGLLELHRALLELEGDVADLITKRELEE